ncbi:MAG: hypothetical protein K2M76_06980, partial [Muribaculaceae bacterium]|nr:hypothetical protein [Muribaculaceae bacterium]
CAAVHNDCGVVDPWSGTGSSFLSGSAETYTKYGASTLWGYGRYVNGRVKNMVWNETADPYIVYPYILADSIGGDMNREQYEFCGGYAAHSGRWAWGMEMSYLAKLEYRGVDPRPRNVVGQLDVSAGLGYMVANDYYAGVSLRLRKYKQSNDVEFKSEMGVDKIYHLTGLATHYYRFAGTGLSTHYDGYRYGVSADVYPRSGRGVFMSCVVSRFSFDNILTDLNKLPLASATHRAIDVEAGWLNPSDSHYCGVVAVLSAYRRHGRENIFGDAASTIYPQICSTEMFADNYVSVSCRGTWGLLYNAASRIGVVAGGGWHRRTTAYVSPWRHTLVSKADVGCGVMGDVKLQRGWILSAECSVDVDMPVECGMAMNDADDAELMQLVNMERRIHAVASMRRLATNAAAYIGHAVGRRYMIQLGVRWHCLTYPDGTRRDDLSCTAGLLF